jgi:ABC-type glycerol-3-phosphate transport system permease component
MLSTLMIPEAVTWIPNFITVTWLGRVGPIAWLNNWPALAIPFMASAFSIFLLRQFFSQIPNELWDSAQIDGAGHTRFLIQIVLPLAKPAMLTVILFTFIGSWNALAWPILVTTDLDWRPIAYGLYSFLDEAGAMVHLQMAGSVITILPILVMYLFVQRQFTEGIATTGLKG